MQEMFSVEKLQELGKSVAPSEMHRACDWSADEITRLRTQRDSLLAALKRAIEFVPAGYGVERECWAAIAEVEGELRDANVTGLAPAQENDK